MLKVSNIGVRVFIENLIEDFIKTEWRVFIELVKNLTKVSEKNDAISQENWPWEYIQKPGLIKPVKGEPENGEKKSFNAANTLVRIAVGV